MPLRLIKEGENPFADFTVKELSSFSGYLGSKGLNFTNDSLLSLNSTDALELLNTHAFDPTLRAAIPFGSIRESDLKQHIARVTTHLKREIPHTPTAQKPYDKLFVSHSCWYGLDQIEELISLNKMRGTGTKYINPGIRIYFGFIPDTYIPDPMHPEILHACVRLTTILVPTSNTKDAMGDIILDPADGNPANQDTVAYVSIAGEAFDHGDLCPPKCQGADYKAL